MIRSQSKKGISIIIIYFIYYFSFQFIYQEFITDIYGYQGYVDDFSFVNAVFSVVLLLVLLFCAPTRASPSAAFVNCIFCFIFVPSMVLFSGQNLPTHFLLITFFAIILTIFISEKIKIPTIVAPQIANKKIIYFLLLFTIINIIGIIVFGGARYLNFDLSKVYDFRRDAAAAIPGIFGYTNSIAAKVAIPFGMALAYISKKWVYLWLFSACSFLLFGLTHHKAPLFTPLVVIFIVKYGNIANFVHRLPLFLAIVIFISGMDFYWFKIESGDTFAGWFGALFANRTLLVPSALNFIYLDLFSGLEKYYWASSKITAGLIKSPYELNAANLIGDIVFGNGDMSANTGWIGSGFANAGYFGVFFYSIILGLWLSLLNSYGRKLNDGLVFALFFMSVITLITSTDFTDMLLTHGLVFAILVLIFISPKNETE